MPEIKSSIATLTSANCNTNLKMIKALNSLENYITTLEDLDKKRFSKGIIIEPTTENTFNSTSLIEDLKVASMLISSILLSVNLEYIVDVKNKEHYINESAFKVLTSFFEKRKDKYYLGDIEFDNVYDAIKIIRNKILHGAYAISGENIIISENNLNGIINFEEFIDYCMCISAAKDCSKNEMTKKIVLNYFVQDENGLDDYYTEVTMDFKLKGNKKFSVDIINSITRELNVMKLLNLTGTDMFGMRHLEPAFVSLETFDKKIKNQYPKLNFDILCNKVTDNILNKAEIFKNKLNYKNDYRKLICGYMEELLNPEEELNYCLRELLYVLKNKISNHPRIEHTNYERIKLIMPLIKFYTYYHYGLDDITSDKVEVNLLDVLEGKKLDYSKMDLDNLYDPNMTIDRKLYIPSTDEINDYIATKEANVKRYEDYLNNYLDKVSEENRKEDKINKFKEQILIAKEDLLNAKKIVSKISSYNCNKYIKNLCIVNHIRNSISHSGNIKLLLDNYNNYNYNYYVFNDKYLNPDTNVLEDTYNKKVSIKDFGILFEYVDDINEVISNNVETSDETYIIREIIENPCIYPEMQKEWEDIIKRRKDKFDQIYILSNYIKSLNYANSRSYKDIMNIISYMILDIHENIIVDGVVFSEEEYEDFVYQLLHFSNNMTLLDAIINSLTKKGLDPNNKIIIICEKVKNRKITKEESKKRSKRK